MYSVAATCLIHVSYIYKKCHSVKKLLSGLADFGQGRGWGWVNLLKKNSDENIFLDNVE